MLSGKLRGLSEQDARRRLVPSQTTLVALDQTVPHDQLCQVSLRWIYVHIIREHTRYIGHADILRGQIDGATGD